MPLVPESKAELRMILGFTEERHDELLRYMELGASEPVYRELYREAVQLVESSPRSALVLCVAAAEIAIKTIGTEFGDKALLEDQHASPAIELYRDKMLSLSARNTFEGKVIAPPRRLLESLEKAVSARNNLVHRGAPPLDRDSLIVKMNDMRDLLLFVDYYSGHGWAHGQMLQETKDETAAALR